MGAEETGAAAQTSPTASGFLHILAIGDSLTAGSLGMFLREHPKHPYSIKLQQLLDEAGTAAKVHQEGLGGERVTETMPARLQHELAQAQQQGQRFDWVLVLGGINDISHLGRGAVAIFVSLCRMYEAARAHGARVLAMTLMESTRHDALPQNNATRQELNGLLRRMDSERAFDQHVVLMDLERHMPMATLTAEEHARLSSDGLHLTAQGYDLMATKIFEALQPLLRQQQELGLRGAGGGGNGAATTAGGVFP